MIQGYNHGCGAPNDNNLSTFLFLMMLCPGMFGGGNLNNILPLILIMSMM